MLKRVFDIVIAGTLLILLSPVLLVVGVMVRIRLGSPVLFRQERPGMYGTPFKLNKFRSMRNATPDELRDLAASDKNRITSLGRFLRNTSLDELPSLWNVVKGDMSIVGPRPLLMSYLDRYTAEQARRHNVRPGITGYAQVNGRNTLAWEEKFKLDVWYVDNASIVLDFKILWATVGKVLARDGIAADGETTMTEFRGSRSKADT